MNENAIHGAPKRRVENGELHQAITTHDSKLVGGGGMNENAIHRAPKKGGEWRIALSNNYAWLILVGEGCMNENAIHGATKKGRERRIALRNHYARPQTRGWRMHERKRNSWGSEKG